MPWLRISDRLLRVGFELALIEREAEARVAAKTVWDRLAKLDWDAWDPDVAEVKDVQGGLVEGGTFTYVLNNGLVFPSRFSEVSDYLGFTWQGAIYAGLLGYWGRIELDENQGRTKVRYKFAMTRPIGWFVFWRYPDLVIHGVEEGLRQIVNLSENQE